MELTAPSNKSDIFATAIIVFERSRHRMGNFHHIKENIIPDIIFFPAADSINDFEKHKARSLEMNYHTDAYLKKYPMFKFITTIRMYFILL